MARLILHCIAIRCTLGSTLIGCTIQVVIFKFDHLYVKLERRQLADGALLACQAGCSSSRPLDFELLIEVQPSSVRQCSISVSLGIHEKPILNHHFPSPVLLSGYFAARIVFGIVVPHEFETYGRLHECNMRKLLYSLCVSCSDIPHSSECEADLRFGLIRPFRIADHLSHRSVVLHIHKLMRFVVYLLL